MRALAVLPLLALLQTGCITCKKVEPVYFTLGTTEFSQDPTASMQEVSAFLEKRKRASVVAVGLTDVTGDPTSNQTLSEARAARIQELLLQQSGLDSSRIEAEGLGEVEVGESQGDDWDRRVEFVFYRKRAPTVEKLVKRFEE